METAHGTVQTPAFMPVGTQGAVKAVTHRDLEDLGAEIILGNTYHLYLKPGDSAIARAGGLHRFIGWRRPILTDSGGYQVFSLAARRRITEEGAEFRSHIDGSLHLLTPESTTDIQAQLGSDIAMVFDECIATPAPADVAREAMERSVRWAARARKRWLQLQDDPSGAPGVIVTNPGQAQFGIIQGGTHKDLRSESVQATVAIGFEAYAIGGLSVGEEPEVMYDVVEHTRTTASRGSTAISHGERDARRPGRIGRPGSRPVRLRVADAERPEWPVAHPVRAAGHQEREVCGGPTAARPGLRVLHLPPPFPGVPAPPLYIAAR